MPYSALQPELIIATAEQLERRIGERFPDAGLRKVARELVLVGRAICAEAARLDRPNWPLRFVTYAGIAAGGLIFIFVGRFLSFDRLESGTFSFVQGIEAAINTLVLAGIGFIALTRLEERWKRREVLKGLHKLRSLIHIIDMHQLTKDPAALSHDFVATDSSPKRIMTPIQLKRYLDYCSELLSLTGKFAALYAQTIFDAEVVNAVNDVETLGTNLSRKIWQKIMLIAETSPRKRVGEKRAHAKSASRQESGDSTGVVG